MQKSMVRNVNARKNHLFSPAIHHPFLFPLQFIIDFFLNTGENTSLHSSYDFFYLTSVYGIYVKMLGEYDVTRELS